MFRQRVYNRAGRLFVQVNVAPRLAGDLRLGAGCIERSLQDWVIHSLHRFGSIDLPVDEQTQTPNHHC